jgi:hypothetical protein
VGDIGSADQFVGRADVLEAEVDGACVLYDLRSRRAHVLNSTASTIWGLLHEPISSRDAAERLVGQDPTGRVEGDVRRTMVDLWDRDLVEPVPNGRHRSSSDRVAERTDARPPFVAVRPDEAPSRLSSTFSLLGREVALASDEASILDEIEWYAKPLRSAADAESVFWVPRGRDVLRTLPARLNRLAAESAASCVIHAGGVLRGEVAVALPGGPGAGKSTLVAALVEHGFDYLSDEALGVLPGGRDLLAYPKRMAIELGSWPLFPRMHAWDGSSSRDGFDPTRVRWLDARDIRPNALAWQTRDIVPQLSVGVFPTYEPGCDVIVERLRPLDTFVALLQAAFNLHVVTAVGLATLRDVARAVPFYRMRHGGIDQAVPAVEALVRAEEATAIP